MRKALFFIMLLASTNCYSEDFYVQLEWSSWAKNGEPVLDFYPFYTRRIRVVKRKSGYHWEKQLCKQVGRSIRCKNYLGEKCSTEQHLRIRLKNHEASLRELHICEGGQMQITFDNFR